MQMRLAIALVMFWMLGGCGFPTATPYVPTNGLLPVNPPGVPANTPIYLIDAVAGANVPVGSYGITTDGVTWYLEWQLDGREHTFTGDIYGSSRSRVGGQDKG
jgi:hypothetical protein